jgi:hypothetical protein
MLALICFFTLSSVDSSGVAALLPHPTKQRRTALVRSGKACAIQAGADF